MLRVYLFQCGGFILFLRLLIDIMKAETVISFDLKTKQKNLLSLNPEQKTRDEQMQELRVC